MKNKTIGIIFALDAEFESYKKLLKDIEEVSYMNHEFYIGTHHSNKIVLTRCGLGKVNAGAYTMILIEHFNPDIVFNSGVAGCLSSKLSLASTVVCEKLVFSDVDMTTDSSTDLKFGQMQFMPPTFNMDLGILQQIEHLNLDVHFGTIMTGDTFMTDYRLCKNIIDNHFADLNILGCDMESAAVAQICFICKVPFVVVRSMSDIVGSNQDIDYNVFCPTAAEKSAKVINTIIENIEI